MDMIEKNIQKLQEAADGKAVCNAINTLGKKITENNRSQVIEALIHYAQAGAVQHMQSHATATVVNLVQEKETEYAEFFQNCMESGDKSKCYWGILGYCKVKQKEAYEYLLKYIFSKQMALEHKALIIKQISKLSQNTFDQNKPYECEQWKEEDIEYEAIRSWVENGYPDGSGYEEPIRHVCLEQPESPAEKLYARLDKKLLKKREKKQDLAHPSNWLIKAEQTELEKISKKWSLPKGYVDFLEKASPCNADFKMKGYGTVQVYGAYNLIKGQAGYSYNPVTNQEIQDWNSNYVVIANQFGNPFCIDITQKDSPVYFAYHGMGVWEFSEEFKTFHDFLKSLG